LFLEKPVVAWIFVAAPVVGNYIVNSILLVFAEGFAWRELTSH
jgi:hypothetical protein